MSIFEVHFKNRKTARVNALSSREDTASGRIYFHRTEDQRDTDTWFLLSAVTGVHKVEDVSDELTELIARIRDGEPELPTDQTPGT